MAVTAYCDPRNGQNQAMRIELLYFEGCPGYERLLPMLKTTMRAAGVQADIELRTITTVAEAERCLFLGSPTVRIDGKDIEPTAAARTDFGLKCRLYRGAGPTSRPADEELIRRAVAHAAG